VHPTSLVCGGLQSRGGVVVEIRMMGWMEMFDSVMNFDVLSSDANGGRSTPFSDCRVAIRKATALI
jgi:hypothetical protein